MINVLERILEEIDKKADYYESDEQGREHIRMVDMTDVSDVIRTHVDEIPGMQIEEIKKINQEMEEYLFEKYNVEGYDEKLDEIFTRYLSICKNVNFSNWIPVSERLPEEGQEVWISTKTECVRRGMYTKQYGFERREGFICDDGFMYMNTAAAWMPYVVPEPYNEQG